MKRSDLLLNWMALFVTIPVTLLLGCQAQPSVPPAAYSAPDLKYLLLSHFEDVFWCDPDFYPVGRPGQEEQNATEQFPTIRDNDAEFLAILDHLGLSNRAEYSNEEKLAIYREYKKLTYAVQMTKSDDIYDFALRVGEGQGYRIEGTITASGEIKVLKQETSFNTCPICLARGSLIDTPNGSVPVEELGKGMAVWTVDSAGKRIIGQVVETVTTPVAASCQVLRVRLDDGRTVIASAGHPTSEGKPLGDYRTGDTLDGAPVVAVEPLVYDGGATYDLLPSGGSGLYWANGILLKSTLATD
jgi:hypothetical protein